LPPKAAELLRLAIQEHGVAQVLARLAVTQTEVDAWLSGLQPMPADKYIALVELRHESGK
jgi:hypothetical protein